MQFLMSLISIVIIDLVLSGDNAVVIAMATVKLPVHQRSRAILWGSLGAIGLRVILTVLVSYLLQVPLLQAIGGLLLVFIAHKLLSQHHDDESVNASSSFWSAIRTIIAADFVMSLDNILAVGGASHGNVVLLLIGLFLSMTLIMWGSTLIAKLMERIPAFVYVGAGILVWTAGKMVVDDRYLVSRFPSIHQFSLVVPAALMTLVLGGAFARQFSRRAGRSTAA